MIARLVLALSLVSIPTNVAVAQRAAGLHLHVKETVLGKIPDRFTAVTGALVISPDGSRFAAVEKVGQQERLVVDGVPQKAYARVIIPVEFSPDSKRLAYTAEVNGKLGREYVVVVDGQESPPFESIRSLTKQVYFSPDSKRVVYVAMTGYGQDAQSVFVVDGKPGKQHPGELIRDGFNFSPDSRRWVAALEAAGSQVAVVSDDVIIRNYKELKPRGRFTASAHKDARGNSPFAFTPDGSHWAYAANEGPGGSEVIVLDGKVVTSIPTGSQKMTPAQKAKVAVISNLELGSDGRGAYQLEAKFATSNQNHYMVVHGKRSQGFRWIYDASGFSPDGKRHAFFATNTTDKRVVVLDGVQSKEYDGSGNPRPDDLVFSPDSNHLAARVHLKEKQLYLIDGRENKAYAGELNGFTYSPDSKRYAHTMHLRNGNCLLVVDGVESEAYANIDEAQAAFSPDSQHVGILAKTDSGWAALIDGVESQQRYPGALQTLTFTAPTTARAVVQRGYEIIRLEITLAMTE